MKSHTPLAKFIHWSFSILYAYGIFKQVGDLSELEDPALLNFEILFAVAFLVIVFIRYFYMKDTETLLGQKTLTIALGYGGRQEILDAIKGLIDENRNKENDFDRLIENVTDEQLRQHLYSPEAPDIDLIIRTSGESRLSGFLLWQSAYSEVIFQDVYWPEFRKIDFLRCLREYAQRERRFGQ